MRKTPTPPENIGPKSLGLGSFFLPGYGLFLGDEKSAPSFSVLAKMPLFAGLGGPPTENFLFGLILNFRFFRRLALGPFCVTSRISRVRSRGFSNEVFVFWFRGGWKGGVGEGLERGWGGVGEGLGTGWGGGWGGLGGGLGRAWISLLQKPRLKNPVNVP